jgi:hypothetical protein
MAVAAKNIRRRRITCMEDLDYNLVETNNKVLVFIDRVLYAKKDTTNEAFECLKRVFETRRCCY